jgi:hypothetical protein
VQKQTVPRNRSLDQLGNHSPVRNDIHKNGNTVSVQIRYQFFPFIPRITRSWFIWDSKKLPVTGRYKRV